MKITAKLISLAGGLNESIICFSMKGKDALSSLEKYKDKEVSVEIKKPSQKRSLNSNSFFWCLCEEIAQAVGTDKDSVYIDMLGKYGKFTHIIVKPEAVDRMMKEWRASKVLGEVLVNGNIGVQIQCYYGSSTYDQTEMNRLLQGTVDECHELGIDTLTPDEIAEMNSRWAV